MIDQGGGAASELQELARSLWRRKAVVLSVLAIVIAATVAMTFRQVKLYEASAEVIAVLSESARVVDSSSEGRLEYERNVANELEFIRSDALRSVMAEELGFVPDLRVTAGDGDRFSFAIRGASPERLASVANTAAEIYVRERNDRTVRDYLDTITSIERQIAELDAEEAELLAPVNAFRNSLDPFEVDASGALVHSAAAIDEYEGRLARLEGDVATELGLLAASRAQLRRTQDDLQLSSSLQRGTARISRRAQTPTEPVSPNWTTNLILGSLAAVLCAAGAGLTLEFFDKRIRSSRDLKSIIGDEFQIVTIPTAPIPRNGRKAKRAMAPGSDLVLRWAPDSDTAQALWELNGLLYFARLNEDQEIEPWRLLVTSAEPSAGKTFVASNFALTTAQSGGDTILVDLDLRRPRVHRMFDLPNRAGVVELLSGEPVEPEQFSENLWVQVSGVRRGNPVELAARAEQHDLPDAWTLAELLIIDTPPLLAAPETAIWASMCDAMLFVVRSGQTKRSDFLQALAKVQALDVHIVVVLTDQRASRSDYKYAAAYDEPEPKARRRRSRSSA